VSEKKLVKEITSRNEDFAKWYTDLCLKAELMDYTDVAGFIIYRPYGYAIWENIQKYLDNEFKKSGHENIYMPLLIPENLFQKEKDHVEGFAPETAIVTNTGVENLSERLIVRPTSEVLFATHYSKIIQSHRDLPKKYNQWCSVVRWEKTTRPFLRGKEFLWQEGHTVHSSKIEAEEEALNMLKIYQKMGEKLLAIPFITGKKTESEKFAGAINTFTIEALMHDGKALQSGTTHYFGQNFAKVFDIKFQNKDSKIEYAYQTSWGVSTRLLGAIIMVHGDDDGLILPPFIAPTQVVIVPIGKNDEVLKHSKLIYDQLKRKKIRVLLDDSKKSPGWKFSEHEMKGIPVRIEIGMRDLERNKVSIFRRFDRLKEEYDLAEVSKLIPNILKEIHNNMYDKALINVRNNTKIIFSYDEFKEEILKGGYLKLSINEDAESIIKEETGASARAILDEKLLYATCPITKKPATMTVLFAKAY